MHPKHPALVSCIVHYLDQSLAPLALAVGMPHTSTTSHAIANPVTHLESLPLLLLRVQGVHGQAQQLEQRRGAAQGGHGVDKHQRAPGVPARLSEESSARTAGQGVKHANQRVDEELGRPTAVRSWHCETY